ncbi:hypothetical protein G7054_g10496 [Neopestalotiopsis clavispora]|nr:hypothetical protein G7054_g10496 [Neopestalotiopsis clavispora]
MNFFRSKSGETEPLEKYINQAWSRGQPIRPFGQPSASATTPPVATLRKGRKNRIIYYIGSFNPPHVGHLALIDHVFSNTKASTSSSSADDNDLNAVALIVIPHAEYWIERKARRAAMEAQAAKYPRGRGRGKSGRGRGSARTGRGSSTNHNHDGDDEEQKELHLPLEQRLELVRDGVPEELIRAGVWLFPADLGAWWEVHPKLLSACADDGFDVEYVELLGPDYVRRERPQRSGMHGVVTSNVCRGADFVIKSDDAVESPEEGDGGREIGEDLLTLNGFTGWDLVRGPGVLTNLGHETDTQLDQGQDGQKAAGDDKSKVFVCRSGVNLEYRIWFVQCDKPQLDPGISSTALRRLIKEVDVENLEDAVRDIAMSPTKLVEFVRDSKK